MLSKRPTKLHSRHLSRRMQSCTCPTPENLLDDRIWVSVPKRQLADISRKLSYSRPRTLRRFLRQRVPRHHRSRHPLRRLQSLLLDVDIQMHTVHLYLAR